MKRLRKKKRGFWDKEYKKGAHLALSSTPSEDLQKFLRWFLREYKTPLLSSRSSVLDLGCGNGRNLVYLTKEFGVKGMGIDTSHEAIAQAKKMSVGLPLSYAVQSIGLPLSVPDQSQDLVLDMMTSHFLNKGERANLYKEIARVLKPSGWLFLKTFLLDERLHRRRNPRGPRAVF
ncbi:MAG: class I SAM-dependent methyltransferase [Parcubacteria group bacterium]|nr:class I SAM-dependent methyltransferase [Parcubacteria group bacterium]